MLFFSFDQYKIDVTPEPNAHARLSALQKEGKISAIQIGAKELIAKATETKAPTPGNAYYATFYKGLKVIGGALVTTDFSFVIVEGLHLESEQENSFIKGIPARDYFFQLIHSHSLWSHVSDKWWLVVTQDKQWATQVGLSFEPMEVRPDGVQSPVLTYQANKQKQQEIKEKLAEFEDKLKKENQITLQIYHNFLRPEDATAIYNLLKEQPWWKNDEKFTFEAFERFNKNSLIYVLYSVLPDGKHECVGYNRVLASSNVATLLDTIIDPPQRRQGYATYLQMRIVNDCGTALPPVIKTTSRTHASLYQRVGYENRCHPFLPYGSKIKKIAEVKQDNENLLLTLSIH